MKNWFILSLLLLSLSSCSIDKDKVTEETLTVLSWNIWHGGHSKEYPRRGCEGILGMMKKSKADVVFVVETYGASEQIADALGYYHRLLSNNLSIYSKYPIVKTYTFPDSIATFNFGGVMIDKNGSKIRLFDTWLHYLPDATKVPINLSEREIVEWDESGTRDDEAKKILSVLSPFMQEVDSIPIVIAGDFNIHSHLDWTQDTKDMFHHGGKVVEWSVSKLMEQAGFKDSFREMNPDPSEKLGVTWRYDDGSAKREDRIDYIYYKGKKLQAIASESHNGLLGEMYEFRGEEFFYASDHGFVLTTFNIQQR